MFSLGLVFFRHTKLEIGGVVFAIVMMSVSSLFYIIFGQWLFSKVLRLVPISGFETGTAMISFLILPIAIGVFSRIGGDALLYRSMFLEEINKDYVRTARAKGLSETAVLFKHILRNASLPILTSTVAVLPMLFLGSLVMESFFGIPGLGRNNAARCGLLHPCRILRSVAICCCPSRNRARHRSQPLPWRSQPLPPPYDRTTCRIS